MSRIFYAPLPERTGSANYECYTAAQKVAMRCARYTLVEIPYLRTDTARNVIVKLFLDQSEDPNDVLVMLDADHKYPPNIVDMLTEHDPQLGVVGALVFRRSFPYDPLMFNINDKGILVAPKWWQRGSIVQCQAVGTGVIAIRRWVFDKLKEAGYELPFFKYEYPKPTGVQSEDVYFAKCCHELGIHHYCDTRVEAPHLIVQWADTERWIRHLNLLNLPVQEKISIIIPSARRPEQAAHCVERLHHTLDGWNFEVIVVVEPLGDGFAETREKYREYLDGGAQLIVRDEWHGPVANWNEGLKHATGEYFVFGADDLCWGDGWLPMALDALDCLPGREGVVGFNDKHTDGNDLATHFLMTRGFCIAHHCGVLAIPCYKQYFTDYETTGRAKRLNSYVWAAKSEVEHKHHLWKESAIDETYLKGWVNSYESDKAIYEERLAAGFPDDFEVGVILKHQTQV